MVQAESLKRFNLFKDTALTHLIPIASRVDRVSYQANQLVFREGDVADTMYLVEVGTIDLIQLGVGVPVLATLGTGSRFGDIAFFDGGQRPVSAKVREPTQLFVIPYRTLQHLLDTEPEFAATFYKSGCSSLARRLRRTLSDLSFARERAA
ncbi:MAG: cyclic nucleotide-binding domain-containing protein [Candidatus Binatia bacterium]